MKKIWNLFKAAVVAVLVFLGALVAPVIKPIANRISFGTKMAMIRWTCWMLLTPIMLVQCGLLYTAIFIAAINPWNKTMVGTRKVSVFDLVAVVNKLGLTSGVKPAAFACILLPASLGDRFIMVDRGFLNILSEREQEAVLLHEVGHAVNKDGIRKMAKIRSLEERIAVEVAADAYAISKGYGADLKSALRKLLPEEEDFTGEIASRIAEIDKALAA